MGKHKKSLKEDSFFRCENLCRNYRTCQLHPTECDEFNAFEPFRSPEDKEEERKQYNNFLKGGKYNYE